MGNLDRDWITKGWLDKEYKKYLILGYQKEVETAFDRNILYPYYPDISFHLENIIQINKSFDAYKKHTLKEIDFKSGQVEV